MGFFISFFFVSFAYINELNPQQYVNASIGFINMFNVLCSAPSEPLIGCLLDLGLYGKIVAEAWFFSQQDYHLGLIILPTGLVVIIIVPTFCKETYAKAVD